MALTEKQRMLGEWMVARDGAEALLRSLLDAKAQSEQRLAEVHQVDPMKRVTGRSAIDNAIASTRRMIDTLNRSMTEMRDEISDADLADLTPVRVGRPKPAATVR